MGKNLIKFDQVKGVRVLDFSFALHENLEEKVVPINLCMQHLGEILHPR
jgi:hypothetical protein